jgi:hypothetical protein
VIYVHPPAVKLALVGHPLTLTEVDSFLNSASRKKKKHPSKEECLVDSKRRSGCIYPLA